MHFYSYSESLNKPGLALTPKSDPGPPREPLDFFLVNIHFETVHQVGIALNVISSCNEQINYRLQLATQALERIMEHQQIDFRKTKLHGDQLQGLLASTNKALTMALGQMALLIKLTNERSLEETPSARHFRESIFVISVANANRLHIELLNNVAVFENSVDHHNFNHIKEHVKNFTTKATEFKNQGSTKVELIELRNAEAELQTLVNLFNEVK